MKLFYVYIFLNPIKPGKYIYGDLSFSYEPFYVGMSKLKNRIYEHLKEAKKGDGPNKHKINTIRKIQKLNYEPIIIKFKEELDFNEACDLEILLISIIGRRNKRTGPLTNLTDGGNGTYGYVPSDEAKKNWKKSIQKYYENEENRKKAGYYSTIEYFIETFGLIEGTKNYYERIQKITKSIHKTYLDPKVRKKCGLKGKKNPMYGKPCPSAIKVEIDNIVYNSIYEASVKTGVPYTTLSQRLQSKNFTTYRILP